MLSSMNIGKRMALAFATLVALALALGASGYWGLSNVDSTAERILTVHVAAADTSGQVQASTLNLRRDEKDYFLNLADVAVRAEYLEKWKSEHQNMHSLLDKLNGLVEDDESHAKISAMRAALAGYDEGFEKVRAEVQSGNIKTPAEANAAITPFKDHIHALENNARVFRTENLRGIREEIRSQMARTTMAMSVCVALVTGLSILLSLLFLNRSETRTRARKQARTACGGWRTQTN